MDKLSILMIKILMGEIPIWKPDTIYPNGIIVALPFQGIVKRFESLSSSNMSCPMCDKDRWKELDPEEGFRRYRKFIKERPSAKQKEM